jgi:hypothetical protein
VTNPAGDAFDVNNSHAVILYICTANGSQKYGLAAGGGSEVTIDGPASFDNNGSGINMSSNAVVIVYPWNGPIDISNNRGPGVWLTSGSVFSTYGSTTIENNTNPPGVTPSTPSTAFGISLLGSSKAQVGTCAYLKIALFWKVPPIQAMP